LYEANPTDHEIRKRIEQTLDESIKTVKEISNNLSPYILNNMGLIKAVESFVEKIKFGKKIDIKFSSNLNVRLADEFEISVYRLITELVNNTIKHSDASRIDLSITHIENEIIVHFQDNGKGFDSTMKA
jgi:signal transduction histidine kinase